MSRVNDLRRGCRSPRSHTAGGVEFTFFPWIIAAATVTLAQKREICVAWVRERIRAGNLFWSGQTSCNRCTQHWVRRYRSLRRPSSRTSSWMALRHPKLRRGRPRARPPEVAAWLCHSCVVLGRPPGFSPTMHISQRPTVRPSAVDTTALMDALGIESAIIGRLDCGARTANIVAALWPERCKAMSGGADISSEVPMPTRRRYRPGEWPGGISTTSPPNAAEPATRNIAASLPSSSGVWPHRSGSSRTARSSHSASSFDNPDHVDIVIHDYRWRLGLAEGEPRYDELERKLATSPTIVVPTITLEGDENGAPHGDPSAYASKFSGEYEHRTITGGVGHNLPQESPEAFVDAIIDVDGRSS